MTFLKKYIKKYWKLFLIPITCIFIEVLADLMQPTIMSKIVDVGVANKNITYILQKGGLMLLVALIGATFASARNIIATRVAQNFGTELRSDLFKKIQNLSLENIDKFERASLITRLTSDVNNIQMFAYALMRIFMRAPMLAIGCVVMAMTLDAKLSIILICIIPIVALIIYAIFKKGYPYFRKVQKSLDVVNGVIREYLSGVRVVKAFNRFDYEKDRFRKVNEDLTDKSVKVNRIMAIFSPSITLVVNIGVLLVLLFGGIEVNNGSIQVGKIIAYTNYMTQLLFALMVITMIIGQLVRAKASIDRIAEIFEEQNIVIEKLLSKESNINTNIQSENFIEFNNVSFSYSSLKGEPILSNINFNIKKGETVGIIGSTGSGKSTLINLIPRFYDVNSGEIKIEGIDVKDYNLQTLREKVAIVPQKALLFSGTIEENIKWGKEDATLLEIQNVCDICDANDFVNSFKDKYQTVLGQRGVNLSGGQKQRLCIARALIKNPEVLILDDSTSAVDTNTEFKIRTKLKEYAKNLTTVIIAQRISSVMQADKIIVLDNGKIGDIGTHQQLLQRNDIYKDIYKSQIGGSFDEKKGGN